MRLLREGGHRGLPAPRGILRGGESRRLCLLFPRGFPCVPHHYLEALFPGPAVIPVFGTAMSGLWASGSREMAWDRCPYHWENHKSGSLGDLGCSGVMVSCGFPAVGCIGMPCAGMFWLLSLAGAYPCSPCVPCIPAGFLGCSRG